LQISIEYTTLELKNADMKQRGKIMIKMLKETRTKLGDGRNEE
jgi:hypothetical protein